MARPQVMVITMYRRYLLVRITPTLPTWKVSSLSSSEEKPKQEADFTSLRHFAQRWIADLVKLTRKGMSMIERNPNIRIDRMATRYPRRLVLYSTIENDTASQKGHLTFMEWCSNKFISSCSSWLLKRYAAGLISESAITGAFSSCLLSYSCFDIFASSVEVGGGGAT
ncbi:hypothetical protein FGO68_gene6773 [Halteria grandinella]|uniref:Uncharacterized protein n=1 Tax=Halteria grandinella TaxID=5974 RepID=A0A8J8NYD7_HALGN|nr:hypothetical protein FGO68_gene6773 [Halteria grandinella]